MTAPEGQPFVIRQVRLGCWPTALALLAGAVVIALALVFSLLFLALFAVIVAGLMIRAWWLRWRQPRQTGGVIETEYEIVEPERRPEGRPEIGMDRGADARTGDRPDPK